MQDSRSLLWTFAALQMEQNLARLEQEGEEKLAVLLAERDRLQREALRKKGLLAEKERQRQLGQALDAQVGHGKPWLLVEGVLVCFGFGEGASEEMQSPVGGLQLPSSPVIAPPVPLAGHHGSECQVGYLLEQGSPNF
nr:PREDICTED: HAUS augmin-like complex subunit 8 [Anolis carolinensis]|eukprot:XP_008123025.1 PREDICTED: HAUS augmin-like complex subunit 8 [Anolis carolinensis]